MRLQDYEGYPDKLNVREVIEGNFSNSEIRNWAIDLLAVEAECWSEYEDETTANFAMALIASCRPIMEVMAMNNGNLCDQEILSIAIATHLNLSGVLVAVKKRAIAMEIREDI